MSSQRNNNKRHIFFAESRSKDGGACGEDGVIEAIFKELDIKCNYCIELGAGDGEKNSVTYRFRKEGSKSLLIDGAVEVKTTAEGKVAPAAGRSSAGSSIDDIINTKNDVKIENINHLNINEIFEKYNAISAPDLMSICLEDYEYQIWKALACRPTIVVTIFNDYVRPDLKLITPYSPEREALYKCKFAHATCSALADLGIKKGYTLVEVCSFKMIFVANEFSDRLNTARDFQNDWLFLYLKGKIPFDVFGSIKCMEPSAQRKALLDAAQYLKKTFIKEMILYGVFFLVKSCIDMDHGS